jgi:hypothetical protein
MQISKVVTPGLVVIGRQLQIPIHTKRRNGEQNMYAEHRRPGGKRKAWGQAWNCSLFSSGCSLSPADFFSKGYNSRPDPFVTASGAAVTT